MKKALLFLLLATPIYSAEKVNLTSPFVADPRSTSEFEVQLLHLDWATPRILVVVGDGILNKGFEYKGQEARDLMVILNKANLTSNSLHKRILSKLIADGFISGNISGTPE